MGRWEAEGVQGAVAPCSAPGMSSDSTLARTSLLWKSETLKHATLHWLHIACPSGERRVLQGHPGRCAPPHKERRGYQTQTTPRARIF